MLASVVVGSGLKSLTGMGLPAIAIPVISIFLGIETAVVVIALPNFVLNGALAWRDRTGFAGTRDLGTLAVSSVLGAMIGSVLFVSVSEEPLVALLLVSVVGYVIAFFAKPESAVPPETSKRWAPVVGAVGGLFQGAIGISGPVVGSWIHSYRLDRSAHVFSLTILFLVSGTTQLLVLVTTGEMTGRWLAGLLACIPALAIVPFGVRIRQRISTQLFDYLVIFAITIAGVGLAVRTFL